MKRDRIRVALTIDLAIAEADSLPRQLEAALDALSNLDIAATFIADGRLADALPVELWHRIAQGHRIGSRGHSGIPASNLGPEAFAAEAAESRRRLAHCSQREIVVHRAVEFVAGGAEPWFGEALSAAGYKIDSSLKIDRPPEAFKGTMALPGAHDSLLEVPLRTVSFGLGSVTAITGTTFRLLPLASVRLLLEGNQEHGFVPMVSLSPSDLDAAAPPPSGDDWISRATDLFRRAGRQTVVDKLRALAYRYHFGPLEDVVGPP